MDNKFDINDDMETKILKMISIQTSTMEILLKRIENLENRFNNHINSEYHEV